MVLIVSVTVFCMLSIQTVLARLFYCQFFSFENNVEDAHKKLCFRCKIDIQNLKKNLSYPQISTIFNHL